jgi:hypothetical protein
MSKPDRSSPTVPEGSIRVARGRASATGGPVSIAWKYENESGQTIWLRPASGIQLRHDSSTPNTP